jgi:aryl carrier-like protein
LDEFETKLGITKQGVRMAGVDWTIHVKVMSGSTFDISVKSNSSIGFLRQKILEKTGLSSIRIIKLGKELKEEFDQKTLQQAQLANEQTIHVVQKVSLQQQPSRPITAKVEGSFANAKIDTRDLIEDEKIYPSHILSNHKYFTTLFKLLNVESVAHQVFKDLLCKHNKEFNFI